MWSLSIRLSSIKKDPHIILALGERSDFSKAYTNHGKDMFIVEQELLNGFRIINLTERKPFTVSALTLWLILLCDQLNEKIEFTSKSISF